MSITQLFLTMGIDIQALFADGTLIVIVLATLIQISPLKINPWSWLKRKLLGENEIIKRLDEMDKKIDRNAADDYRFSILQFDDELRMKVPHSHEMFNQILEIITAYENYCKLHPDYQNTKAVMAVAHIKKVYSHCVDENSFI